MQWQRRLWKVAHRGSSGARPENTLAAFELAIAQGADVIEADVRRTKDGVLLVLHDATVDRTTDGSGPLRDLTAEQAQALDAGHGERIPTLAEVLELARGRVRVNVDLKEADIVEDAVEAVRWADLLDSVSFISFLPEIWEQLAELSPESPRIHLVQSAAGLASLAMGDHGSHSVASGVGIPHELVNDSVVEFLQRQGLGVFAWVVDDEAEMARLIDLGVNGIVTNRPGVLAELVAQRAQQPG
jgi:glycerophosphoryl diester phosphodiesterase